MERLPRQVKHIAPRDPTSRRVERGVANVIHPVCRVTRGTHEVVPMLFLLLMLPCLPILYGQNTDPCYDKDGKPRQCIPDFVNAAFGRNVEYGEDCVTDPKCAEALTDLHNPSNTTCWTSDSSRTVNLTLRLGKKYELTYVSVQFCGQKADAMVIYKSMNYGETWIPMQFYSSQCRRTFGKFPGVPLTRSNAQEALCSEDHTPGSRVAFSVLEGRPSAYDFDNSPVLQDWVTATDIRIALIRIQRVISNDTNSSFSLSDLSLGGRCKCNGHASRCLSDTSSCDCRHNTAGRDCERCKPFHFDRPWSRATARDAHECVGKSSLFFLPFILFARTFLTVVLYILRTFRQKLNLCALKSDIKTTAGSL